MKKLLIATKNVHKLEEFRAILVNQFQLLSLFDFPDIPDIEETGNTLEANALIKARALFAATVKTTISDDSGLIVNALDGQPGVYSARYAGGNSNDKANRDLLLKNLENLSDRSAYFECCIIWKDKDVEKTFTEKLYGTKAREEKGKNGFGYDSIFIPEGSDRTLAEYSESEKNGMSHRFLASRELINWLSGIN